MKSGLKQWTTLEQDYEESEDAEGDPFAKANQKRDQHDPDAQGMGDDDGGYGGQDAPGAGGGFGGRRTGDGKDEMDKIDWKEEGAMNEGDLEEDLKRK